MTVNHITIKNLEIECIIGIYPWERTTPQTISLDLKAYLDFSKVLKSHSIHDTVDYVEAARLAEAIAKKGRYKLLEALASDIATELFEKLPILELHLELKKPNPRELQARYVGISYRVKRGHESILSPAMVTPLPRPEDKLVHRDKVVLVTGSAKGLGKAFIQHFADLGCQVAIHYRESKTDAENFAASLKKHGTHAKAFQGELSKLQSMNALAQNVVSEFGQIDYLINNVGAYTPKGLFDMSPEEFEKIIGANINGTYFLTRAVLPSMRKNRFGRIINIGQASCDQVRSHKTETPYHISKTGVLILTKSIAALEAPHGITCNMISPGIMFNTSYFPPHYEEKIPAGRLGMFEDIFGALDYLLSPETTYVTGASIEVSGGYGL